MVSTRFEDGGPLFSFTFVFVTLGIPLESDQSRLDTYLTKNEGSLVSRGVVEGIVQLLASNGVDADLQQRLQYRASSR